MFRLMRNVHLALGVGFFFVALLFAFSSIVLIYRPWFPSSSERSHATAQLERGLDARAAALALMRSGMAEGELRNIRESEGKLRFLIWRPGTQADTVYAPETGEATLDTRRYNFYETLVQLHVNHGFFHDFMPANLWALLALGVSVGLLLLGASGIYLWYRHPKERRIGTALIALGFAVPAVALFATRLSGG
ncbi:MAG: hypothetical protein KJZ70_18305 [Bryobacterales bacterium]|nr:hypothetical protein [Bryobacterales bacterium]